MGQAFGRRRTERLFECAISWMDCPAALHIYNLISKDLHLDFLPSTCEYEDVSNYHLLHYRMVDNLVYHVRLCRDFCKLSAPNSPQTRG